MLVIIFSCGKDEDKTPRYSVSGRVVDSRGVGVAEVKIYFTPTAFALSDSDGMFTIVSLSGENTITPVKQSYRFDPSEVVVTTAVSNLQFIATNMVVDSASLHEREIFNWFKNLQLPNGLLESTDNGNMVSLYDNALAALVFMSYADFDRTEKIFDYFNARIFTELMVGKGGFSQFRDRNGNPNYHRWMGDNAWLLIALNNYKALTGSTKYLQLSSSLEAWLRALQDTDGGLWGGWYPDNSQIHKITEGNIDAFNAVLGYDTFHAKLLNFLKNDRWNATDKLLVAWPDNIQYYYALDMHSWGYCIFEDFPTSALSKADQFLTTATATANGVSITGYCFDIDKDDVWLEGTGQMAVALQAAGLNTTADYYIAELEKIIIGSTIYTNTSGIPYATNLGTGYGNSLLWSGADTKPTISSCAWYLFAKHKFDPLRVGRTKSIPPADKFWVN